MRRKKDIESSNTTFISQSPIIKRQGDGRELKTAIKETNKNIKAVNKKRRELGEQITLLPMDQLIPIKRAINKGFDGFEYQDKLGFFDIVKVVSFDYSAMDDEDLNMHIFYWDRYYRTTSIPLKRLSLNMPVDTTQQIIYYKNILNRTKNSLYREKIKKEIEELRSKFEKRQTRDYYLFFYADNFDSLINESAHISASLEERGYVMRLSPIKKLQVLNKLSNPYSCKTMLTEKFV